MSLNYGRSKDEEGSDTYQTYLGSLLSLSVKGLFVLCILYFALRMFYYADNNNNQILSLNMQWAINGGMPECRLHQANHNMHRM